MDLSLLSRSFLKAYDLGLARSETTYEATRTATRQQAIVKLGGELETLRRIAAVKHPNVILVLEVGDAGPVPFVAYERLEASLEVRLAFGPMPAGAAVDIALDCAKGALAARRHGLAARLDADHVLFAPLGQAKVGGLTPALTSDEDDTRALAALFARMVGPELAGVPADLAEALARATTLDALAAALRPHASRTGAVVDAPAAEQAPAVPEAEPLPAGPLIVSGGGALRATRVIPLPRPAPAPLARLALFACCALFALFTAGVLSLSLGVRMPWHPPVPHLVYRSATPAAVRADFRVRTDVPCLAALEYWLPASPATRAQTAFEGPSTQFRPRVEKLLPGTRYAYRWVFAHRAGGERWTSDVYDVTTLPALTVTDMHVDEYTTKAVITWQTNRPADTRVIYGRSEDLDEFASNRAQFSEQRHSISLVGLQPDTTYHCRLASHAADGTTESAYSETLTFRTLRSDPELGAGCATSVFTLTAIDKEMLLTTRTVAIRDAEFYHRLQLVTAWARELTAKGVEVGDPSRLSRVLTTLFYTNAIQASQRLDSIARKLWHAEQDGICLEDLSRSVSQETLEQKLMLPGPESTMDGLDDE